MVRKRVTVIFLLSLTAFALYLSYKLFQPFLYPLLSAAVIAVVFFPVHARIQILIRRPSLAALSSTLLVTLIIILPALFLLLSVVNEAGELKSVIDQKSSESGGLMAYSNSLVEKVRQWLGRFGPVPDFNLQEAIKARAAGFASFLANELTVLVGGITSFIIDAMIAIFTLFFLFREGRSMVRRLAALMPFTPQQVEGLFTGIENTIIGTVYGGLVVAAVQGAMTGLALWVFGIHSPILWGVAAAFFALLPVVGTAVVWAPAALYLLATGHWVQAVLLVVWGALIVGSIDNVLRPLLISGRVQMHTLLIFFAVFGGVNLFGFLGLFIGPVIIAVTQTLLTMLREEGRAWMQNWRDEAPALAPPPDPALD